MIEFVIAQRRRSMFLKDQAIIAGFVLVVIRGVVGARGHG
jgi:hypothetical protein